MATSMTGTEATLYQRPAELLQKLIQFNTTNPPGNEAECIAYISRLLASAGIETTILAGEPDRPNLIARLAGRGEAPPLLLYAHIDVASTENQAWKYPPFEGIVAEGCVWGRGALDDKGGASMSLSAFLRAVAEGVVPPGDVVLAILSDEEYGGGLGARYLVDVHPDLFAGIRYAIGESGGFAFYLGGRKFYPIMVAEKRYCTLKATVHGPAAHGATVAMHGGAVARLGRLLTRLDRARMPVHVTFPARQMLEQMAAHAPFPTGLVLRLLLLPALTDPILEQLGPSGQAMYPLLHDVVNVTRVHGGEQPGASPSEIGVEMFACILPGRTPEDLVAELRRIAGDEVEFEIGDRGEAGPTQPDLGLFDTLCDILRKADPGGIPAPLLLTAPTDARHFARLGIQTYGFQPLNLPPEINMALLAHAADERVPVEAMEFGAAAIYQVLQRFGTT